MLSLGKQSQTQEKKLTDHLALYAVALLAVASFGLYAVQLFGHLSYPLLWNDEAETAMFGERILQFGYPKVHDGKNILNIVPVADISIGVQPSIDAYVVSGWTQYYVGAIGAYLGNHATDIYTKTRSMRLPFTFLGLLGVIVFAAIPYLFFRGQWFRYLLFIALFFMQLTIAVPLTLHLRQARYYPVLVLLLGAVLFLYVRHRFFQQPSRRTYNIGMIVLLFFIFLTYYPAYAATIINLFIFESISFLIRLARSRYHTGDDVTKMKIALPTGAEIRTFSQSVLPFFVSVLTVIPLMFFFKIWALAQGMQALTGFTFIDLVWNFLHEVSFFWLKDFLALALFLKLFVWIWDRYRPIQDQAIKRFLHVSFFLFMFFFVYLGVVSLTPWFVFERYYIVVEPCLTLSVLLDFFVLIHLWGTDLIFLVRVTEDRVVPVKGKFISSIGLLIAMGIYGVTLYGRFPQLKNYHVELSQQYLGPVDYAVAYIQKNFQHPDQLVIATNYEEQAYMFYLGSKVTIGFSGNNLAEDEKIIPDIIIPRKAWPNNQQVLADLTQRASYRAVLLPVFDYPANNIPEEGFWFNHLYQTPFATSDDGKLVLYIRNK